VIKRHKLKSAAWVERKGTSWLRRYAHAHTIYPYTHICTLSSKPLELSPFYDEGIHPPSQKGDGWEARRKRGKKRKGGKALPSPLFRQQQPTA
jgi:hypothetical protein